MVTIAEYRQMLNDRTSSDEQIKTRLDYLEGFCRNVIKAELQAYVDTKKLNREQDDQLLRRA